MQPGVRNYHLTWQDLQKVTTERNQVSIHATKGYELPPYVARFAEGYY